MRAALRGGVDDVIQVLTLDPEEWKERAKQRPDDQSALVDLIVFVLLLIVFLMILRSVSRQSRAYLPGGASRRGGWSGPIIVPMPGSWDSDPSNSSWSDSSGGFSGGGGSFGGGGASGSW